MSVRRYSILWGFLLALLLVISGCGSKEAGKEKNKQNGDTIVLKFAHESPESSTIHEGIKHFTDRVTELTDGKVQFEIYPAQQLGSASDYLGLTSDGVADMSNIYPAYFPSEMANLANISGLPGLYTSNDIGTKAYWDFVNNDKVLESDFLKNGIRPIAPVAGNSFELFTTKAEIRVPADLKGMKIRSSGGVVSKLMEYYGAIPVQMPIGDAYSALDQGIIDAVNTGFEGTRISGIDELLKFSTKGVTFGANMSVYSINEELFQSFSKDIQKAFLQAGQEGALYTAKILADGENEILNRFYDDKNVTVYEPTGDGRKQWDNAHEEFVKNNLNEKYKEAYEIYKKAVDKYSN